LNPRRRPPPPAPPRAGNRLCLLLPMPACTGPRPASATASALHRRVCGPPWLLSAMGAAAPGLLNIHRCQERRAPTCNQHKGHACIRSRVMKL
jgi:hypothetical protein